MPSAMQNDIMMRHSDESCYGNCHDNFIVASVAMLGVFKLFLSSLLLYFDI